MSNILFDGLFSNADRQAVLANFPDGGTLSYGEALDRSARMAHGLVARGVGRGDRVAVQVDKSIDAVLLYIACLRVGAAFLPLNTAYTPAEVSYFLTNARPSLFVCTPKSAGDLQSVAATVPVMLETMGDQGGEDGTLLDGIDNYPVTFENVACTGDDLAAILYTSGTTGRSKGAMLSHANLLSNAETLRELWQFSADDRLLHALPIFHTHGLFVATNITLMAGASMIFLPGFKTEAVLEHLPNATAMMGVPTFYTRLLADERFTRQAAEHMRLFISGSAPLLAETHLQFEERTGKRILERYGMTETNMITSNPYDGERRAGTVGFPLPGVEVRICDPDSGAAVPDGEIGVLEVRGPNVFSGYWEMPEKTAEDFRDDGFFITGDLATVGDDGYIAIVGRSKDLIISGGYNIYPKEIELLLDDEPGVVESAVIGVPHPDFGEGIVALLVSKEPNFDADAVLASLRDKVARFKHPKHVEVVDELPRNTMGKVQKNVLRDRYQSLFAPTS